MYKITFPVAVSFCFLMFLMATPLQGLCRWAWHGNERGAWGGNGGWWGNSRSDWYGEYGTPEEHNHFGNYTTPHRSRCGYYQGYYSENVYPHCGQYYNDTVDGAALYFRIR